MKTWSLFLGSNGMVGTFSITADPRFRFCIDTAEQVRTCILNDQNLRQPYLDLLLALHKDNAQFPNDLKSCTPLSDQVSNQQKIQQLHPSSPTDADIVNFFTNSFPDIYLIPGTATQSGAEWGLTVSGRGEASKEYISIAEDLVQVWNTSITKATQGQVAARRLQFMFMSVLLHEIGHSILVGYAQGACDSPELDGIEREAGNFIEKRLWGGVSAAEFGSGAEGNILLLEDIGIMRDGNFFSVDEKLALQLSQLDTSNGFPLVDLSTLHSAAPIPIGSGRTRSKMSSFFIKVKPSAPKPPKRMSQNIRPVLGHDKIRIMPPGA
jgi:hypothetical protein